jgi:tetratricopeptide (TPR) repeat protein
MFVYALTIFLGAFLLFEVQPLTGKYILPWFGGASAVWTTCLLFFQILLLAGYAYAHCSARWLKPRAQAILHLVLLLAALALLPITPSDAWKPHDSADPTLRILGLLVVSLGLPFFVLAATSPLLQHWFSRTNPGVSPYRLYALSNVGSLLALVSYPVYFETHFTRKAQAMMWGWGLVLYALSCGLCAIKLWKAKSDKWQVASDEERGTKHEIQDPTTPTLNRLLWLLLPACASVLLLATTNKLCQEVAVIPFLWVLPLALYLLSFILCFDSPRWYRRTLFIPALLASWGLCWAFFTGPAPPPVNLQLILYPAALFICCMVCHGELYRLRPDPRHLTGYYLMIAAGGALGGLLVAIVAPLIFHDYYELQWGLMGCGGLLLVTVCRPNQFPPRPMFWRYLAGVLILSLAAFGCALWQQARPAGSPMIYKTRNFYGVLTVISNGVGGPDEFIELDHGHTLHGLQFADPSRASWPTTYYIEKSGVGLAMNSLSAGHRRVGLVGLGIGTLAAYAQAGDDFHFYEINPEVQRLAGSRFTYLPHCPGKVEFSLGDARLSLEREPPQNFDLLVLDAFNSDAIPVHLLTGEAFSIYERHLKTNGLIAVHVSNRNLNLEPVVYNIARQFHYHAATIVYVPPSQQWWQFRSIWILLSPSGEFIDSAALHLAARPPQTNAVSIPLWTDDFTSLFQILQPELHPHVDPEFTAAQNRTAQTLWEQGDFAGAIATYRLAMKRLPDSPDLLNNLAMLLATCPNASLRNLPEAVALAERSCQLTIYNEAPSMSTLGFVYGEAGQLEDAIWMMQKTCALASESGDEKLLKQNQELLVVNLNNLAWKLATSEKTGVRNGARAVQLAEQACGLTHYRVTPLMGTLAAAYAEAGRFDEAVATGQKACALATELGETNLLKRNQELVTLYQAHQPYHESIK